MKQEFAEKWIAALRSGKYEQGTHALNVLETHDKHGKTYRKGLCCLGVLCEVAIESGLKIDKPTIAGIRTVDYDGENMVLPESVKEYVGMKTVLGEFGPSASSDTLAEKNDNGATFTEIANLIEKHWEIL